MYSFTTVFSQAFKCWVMGTNCSLMCCRSSVMDHTTTCSCEWISPSNWCQPLSHTYEASLTASLSIRQYWEFISYELYFNIQRGAVSLMDYIHIWLILKIEKEFQKPFSFEPNFIVELVQV